MLPDNLCRRDVPGLDEAILASEYAQLERLSEEEVIASIAARRLLGAQVRGVWYVEAPSFCEAVLSRLRSRRKPPHEDAPNNGQSQPSAEPVSDEISCARVLGLSGRVTFDDIKRHYRERVREYHPDKVAALGLKLRELAEDEMKKINAAYEFFNAKYGNDRKTER